MTPHLRIARPASDPRRVAAMYCEALRWEVLGSFDDHDGFDGVMVGPRGGPFHLELTRHHGHAVMPTPTAEDLLVFYVPDAAPWAEACARFVSAGFREVDSFNPYWSTRGRTFVDPDGYRVVVQRDRWAS